MVADLLFAAEVPANDLATLVPGHAWQLLSKYAFAIGQDPVDYWVGGEPNEAAVGGGGRLWSDVFDAIELLCEAARQEETCDLTNPPAVETPGDLLEASRYLNCAANEIERGASLMTFKDLPLRAVDALRKESVIGSFPAVGGEYQQAMSGLRLALTDAAEVQPLLSDELRRVASEMDNLRLFFAQRDLDEEIEAVRFLSTTLSIRSSCAAAAGGALSITGAVQALASCANVGAQINFAAHLRDLAALEGDLSRQLALQGFEDGFARSAATLRAYSDRLREAAEAVERNLAQLESLRTRGRRLLAKARFQDTDSTGVHYEVNTVMRRRFSTTRIRYERARIDAIKMAYLAKRSIEQRLGIRLSRLGDDMTLVEAPSSWEASLCTMEGIDYERVRDATAVGGGDGTVDDNYAGAFIGDYVTKLERVVASYRLDFPFQDGTDTTVVSLRDEIHNVRRVCDDAVANLVYQAGQLYEGPMADAPGWEPASCASEEDCALARPLAAADYDSGGYPAMSSIAPFSPLHPEISTVTGQRVLFGDHDDSPGVGGMQVSSELSQPVDLPVGRFRVSWHAASVLGPTGAILSGPAPGAAVDVRNGATGTSYLTSAVGSSTDGLLPPWTRYWKIFDVADAATASIGVVPNPAASPLGPQQIDIAGIMLEDVTSDVVGSSYVLANEAPRIFANTGTSLTRQMPACEDTDGRVFRQGQWRRGCLRLCADGFGTRCDGDAAQLYCYWETSFGISQRDIERGRVIQSGGFARGNYNYRIESLAFNVVGTDVRDCSTERVGSTCYATGSVPFSLYHVGPYTVRNHLGERYDARLFEGRVEHARALAAERYLTNPLSSADRALISDYYRLEMRGRPIDGTYVLRIWDEPGVRFDRIEDVQLLLKYRYWTRLD